MVTLNGTPHQDGYHMPGEFEPHSGCWMLWPERPDNWRMAARPAQKAFAEVAIAIARFEPVTVGVVRQHYLNARDLLPGAIRVVEISYDDSWIRDCGPTFVVNNKRDIRGIDWMFNSWGGLYPSWDQDDQVAQKVLEIERVDRYKAPIVLEGGSIHVDGQGTLITTEECLLNPNRNPSLSKKEIECHLRDYLNVEKIIWLSRGVYYDETSGHVDNLCCFVRPGVVALTWTDDKADPQYEISLDAYERLREAKDARGRSLEIHRIHQPGPLFMAQAESEGIDLGDSLLPRKTGDRLPASYISFYLPNGGVIVPLFDDPHDSSALEVLRKLFPDRAVVGLPTREIIISGGNIHCILQQVPLGGSTTR